MRRRYVPPAGSSDQEPPQELRHFTQQGRWSTEAFTAFLRAREAWRDTHSRPLPTLPPLERVALDRLGLAAALMEAEKGARKGSS